jgi:hypothetical protein
MIELDLPANWQEIFEADSKLTGAIETGYYCRLMRILGTEYKGDGDGTARFEAIKMFTGLTGYKLGVALNLGTRAQRRKAAARPNVYAISQIVGEAFPALDFIFKREPFYENPIPQFTHKGITYQGPQKRLLNQTGHEWSITHYAHVQYHQTGDDKHLCDIIAANYHRVLNGQRLPLNEHTLATDSAAFATLPDEIKQGIWLWYNNCEDWWNQQYMLLYGEGDGAGTTQGKAVWDLMFELSGASLGKDFDKVMHRSRQQIYMALDKLEERRQKMEASLKQ